jgi:anti-sigma factor RsiW
MIFRRWRLARRAGGGGPTNPLSCKELVELVTDYLEGTLDEATRARFEEHIAGCDGCTEYVAQMEETIRLVGHVEETQLSGPARSTLMAAFQDWKTAG